MTRVEYIATVQLCVMRQYFDTKKHLESLKRKREWLFKLSMSAFDHERFMAVCKFPRATKEAAE